MPRSCHWRLGVVSIIAHCTLNVASTMAKLCKGNRGEARALAEVYDVIFINSLRVSSATTLHARSSLSRAFKRSLANGNSPRRDSMGLQSQKRAWTCPRRDS